MIKISTTIRRVCRLHTCYFWSLTLLRYMNLSDTVLKMTVVLVERKYRPIYTEIKLNILRFRNNLFIDMVEGVS